MLMSGNFKTTILCYCIFSFVLAGASQGGNLTEEDKLHQMPGDPHESSLLIDQIAGVYKKRFENGDVMGNIYTSENILEIVKVNENTIYFKIRLECSNYHSCFLFGTAYYTKDKAFLFKGGYEQNDCNLKIVPTDKGITLVDGPYGSKACTGCCCGVRGDLDGTFFKRSLRRPIKYMKLLKNSNDYQESIKALNSLYQR